MQSPAARRGATVMIQGTGSSVGKSVLATALCALFTARGYRVAPFKALNMSNNAAVTPAGFEIARAQAVQAWACGIDPAPDMNPILLKPQSERASQLVLHGRAVGTLADANDTAVRARLRRAARASLARMRAAYDLVVIEGAGSPAEVNLRPWDVANMWLAKQCDAPVLLAGDIERGGVIAALVGTLALLPPRERRLVKGVIVNKFRGDPALFAGGVAFLERRLQRPVFGVVPYIPRLLIAQEDGEGLRTLRRSFSAARRLRIAVVTLPGIANYDELTAFEVEPEVEVAYTADPHEVVRADAIVLPGSKATLNDLRALRRLGLDAAIVEAARAGRAVFGICGGYQMLGERLEDPVGRDGGGAEAGLGLLPVVTRFDERKTVRPAVARIEAAACGLLKGLWGMEVSGYEIHAGQTRAAADACVALRGGDGSAVGTISATHRVLGTYLHGAFEDDAYRHALLAAVRGRPLAHPGRYQPRRELARLVDAVGAALDLAAIEALFNR